ncbi:hypothetical protein [Cetobacterium sp.]
MLSLVINLEKTISPSPGLKFSYVIEPFLSNLVVFTLPPIPT